MVVCPLNCARTWRQASAQNTPQLCPSVCGLAGSSHIGVLRIVLPEKKLLRRRKGGSPSENHLRASVAPKESKYRIC
jgi:hypothetical protein